MIMRKVVPLSLLALLMSSLVAGSAYAAPFFNNHPDWNHQNGQQQYAWQHHNDRQQWLERQALERRRLAEARRREQLRLASLRNQWRDNRNDRYDNHYYNGHNDNDNNRGWHR
jgi:hypothetical protein